MNVDVLKNNRLYIDVKGNNIRVILSMNYGKNTGFLKWIGWHKDYDKLGNKIHTINSTLRGKMNWNIIKSEGQYNKALLRMEAIFDVDNNSKNSDEFDLLSILINKYEEEHFKIEAADPIQVIKMKMDYMDLKQKDLIPYFGSKSTTSKILSYKAPLSLKHIWLLSEMLNLPIELLAKPYKINQWNFMQKFNSSIKSNLKANV